MFGLVSLRTRLLVVFSALAIIPLISLSVFEYVRSNNAVDRLIADQTAPIADRAARRIGDRFQIMKGDLRLLAGSQETARMYEDHAANRRVVPGRFLEEAWRVLGSSYAWLSFRDTRDVEVARFGTTETSGNRDNGNVPLQPLEVVSLPLTSAAGQTLGRLIAAIRIDALTVGAPLEMRFGRDGYTMLADSSGVVLFDPASLALPHGSSALAAIRVDGIPVSDTCSVLRTVAFNEYDSARVATVASVPSSPLLVISSGVVSEFSGSFTRARITNLVLAMMLTAVLVVAFIIVTRRMMRPLETLTVAASEIGRGNFRPTLPTADVDEVGRLTTAFATMSAHVDRMMGELESSRQMVAVGSFARQISHEIRNPLTSIKLNLQSLERDARDGLVAPDNRRTVEICLEEIERLDRVVRGVLKLGRGPTAPLQPVSLTTAVERAIDVVRAQLAAQGIALAYEPPAVSLEVAAHEEQLVGVFLNLLVNAVEAMPAGGTLRVSIEEVGDGVLPGVARVTVTDTGPGVPTDVRSWIFDPFYTTKSEGSGLGLALAARDAEQHRGHLVLLEQNGTGGASFAIELPLAITEDA